jgi:acyl-coenzyme A synthetase/AMP-(fatty) acid ligase
MAHGMTNIIDEANFDTERWCRIKEIEFNQNLPKTHSDKIMRRRLKARELGLAERDVSTLEG